MNDEVLILAVQPFKELYDMSHEKYSNSEWKDNCWEDISRAMKRPVTTCKAAWRRLREGYRKARARQTTKSGAAATKKRLWKYERQMAFLAIHVTERETQSNIDEPNHTPESQTSQEEDHAISNEEDNDDEECSNAVDTNDCELSAVDDGSMGNSKSSFRTNRPNSNGCARGTPNPSADIATAYLKYLQDKPKRSVERNPVDKLTKFFMSMAETVQSFPPSLQVEVKSKVFTLINDYEMRVISDHNRDAHNPERTLSKPEAEKQSCPVKDMYHDEQRTNTSHFEYGFRNDYLSGGSDHRFNLPTCAPTSKKPTIISIEKYHSSEQHDDNPTLYSI